MRMKLLKIAGGSVLVLVALIVSAWLAFVPFAKEPDYQFVASWGDKGTGPGEFHDPTGIAIAGTEVLSPMPGTGAFRSSIWRETSCGPLERTGMAPASSAAP